jgi:hypothetical protein
MYYFCAMVKKTILFLFFGLIASVICVAQSYVRTIDIIGSSNEVPGAGQVTIDQSPAIDTLIGRNIAANKLKGGLDGYRIQIYRGSGKAGQEGSDKAKIKFISEFPDIPAVDIKFDKPNWFKVRVGNYRTKLEATKAWYQIKTIFKDSYIVEETIEFPDLNK